jgi:GntR family transcriptional regulator / MocR family aminotransferase
LASAGRWGKVVYIGSLSKLITPSLRSGYIVGAKNFIDQVSQEVLYIDRQGDPAAEMAVAYMIESGEIRRHAQKVLRVYDDRRQLFSDLLKRHFGDEVDFEIPEGGLAFWVRFPANSRIESLVANAASRRLKILPGSAYSIAGDLSFGFRFGFASLNDRELSDAVSRLAASWQDVKRR